MQSIYEGQDEIMKELKDTVGALNEKTEIIKHVKANFPSS